MNSTFRVKLAKHMLEQSKGFTLIELLVVIVIVGVLSAVAIPTFLNQVQRSRFTEGESAIATVASALTVYAFDCGSYGGAPVVTADALSIVQTCGGLDKGPWLEQEWDILAPNYSQATIAGDISGGTITTAGDAASPYAGIACTKGVGNSAAPTDGCVRP